MATHKIGIKLSTKDIGNNNIEVSIVEDGHLYGDFEITKAGIRYHVGGDERDKPYIINWKQLTKLIEEHPEFRK